MVAIPLCLQLVCLGTLGWLVNWQSGEVQKHFHVRIMQENMSSLLKSALDSGLSIVKYKVKQDPAYLVQFDEQLSSARAAMDAVETEAKDNERPLMIKVRASFDNMVNFAQTARNGINTESRLEALGSSIHMKKTGGKVIMALQNDVSELERELMTDASEGPGTLQTSTKFISILIYAASACACVLAFFVHRFFTDSITERLKTLTDNTLRLARSETLHPQDPGTDEIGHLDRVFHEMANALAEAARKERAVVQHALDVICSVDAEGQFIAVSPASTQVWGFAPEELVGTKLFDMVAPRDLTATHAAFAGIRSRETEPQPFETQVIKKDGTLVHILWSAYWAPSEESMFCVAHDITDRKNAEDQLRASEARVRSIFESAPVALLVLDDKGVVNVMNPRAESMFGYRMEQFVDRHFSELVPSSQEFAPELFCREILEQTVGRVRELEAVERTGRMFPIELTFDHYQTAEGERYLAAVLDVTERHEVERLKREFVSTVSHELRTPLTAIRGSLTLLAVGALGKLNDQADKAVNIAERNCLRLISLINDLLDIEKLEAGKLEMVFEEIDFIPVIERSIDSVRAFAEQYAVSIEASNGDARIFADSDRLIQVLINLLSNAVKFSPKGGTVSIALEKSATSLKVCIVDQGRGIPAEFQDKVFERFQQVETADSKKKGGTGLGLAICKAIVEQHNGTIGVDSEDGKGSKFWFEIPLAGTASAARLSKKERQSTQPVLISLANIEKTDPVYTTSTASGPQPVPLPPNPSALATDTQQPESVIINIAETNKVAEERT